ncbi:MAG: hypothetical protein LBS25_08390, partial [Candidatus Symbiothrix sp.]|nr:hypothetical protein [Candidatus Symbiothrix sp.]
MTAKSFFEVLLAFSMYLTSPADLPVNNPQIYLGVVIRLLSPNAAGVARKGALSQQTGNSYGVW